jgi:hypothetical protein
LGIEVAQSKNGIVSSQRKHAMDILEETGLLGSKLVDTSMDPNTKLLPNQEEPLSNLERDRRLVGKLNYLSHSCRHFLCGQLFVSVKEEKNREECGRNRVFYISTTRVYL